MMPALEPNIPCVHWATTLFNERELVIEKILLPFAVKLVISVFSSPSSLKVILSGSTSSEFAVQVIFNWSGTIRLSSVALKMMGTKKYACTYVV